MCKSPTFSMIQRRSFTCTIEVKFWIPRTPVLGKTACTVKIRYRKQSWKYKILNMCISLYLVTFDLKYLPVGLDQCGHCYVNRCTISSCTHRHHNRSPPISGKGRVNFYICAYL